MSLRLLLLFLSPRVRRVFGLWSGGIAMSETEARYRIAGRRGYVADPPQPRERALLRGKYSR